MTFGTGGCIACKESYGSRTAESKCLCNCISAHSYMEHGKQAHPGETYTHTYVYTCTHACTLIPSHTVGRCLINHFLHSLAHFPFPESRGPSSTHHLLIWKPIKKAFNANTLYVYIAHQCIVKVLYAIFTMSLKLHSKALYLNRSYTYLVPIGQFPTLCLNYKLPNDLDMCDSHLTQH